MFTKTTQGTSKELNMKTNSVSSAKSRRTIKLVVQLSIGIIGLIGIMLAQIADRKVKNDMQILHSQQAYSISDFSHGISDKVERLSQVQPAVRQITLANILF